MIKKLDLSLTLFGVRSYFWSYMGLKSTRMALKATKEVKGVLRRKHEK